MGRLEGLCKCSQKSLADAEQFTHKLTLKPFSAVVCLRLSSTLIMELFLNDWNALAFTRDCLGISSKVNWVQSFKTCFDIVYAMAAKDFGCCYRTGDNIKKHFGANLLSIW